MQALVALIIIGVIIFGYIKAWIWIGGKIGEAIGKALDRCHENHNVANSSASRSASLNQRERGAHFDKVLYEIQRKKRRE